MAFLDETGLAELWSLIKGKYAEAIVGNYTGTDQNTKSLTFNTDKKPQFVMVYKVSSNGGINPVRFGYYPSVHTTSSGSMPAGTYMLGYREGSSDQAPISMPVTWSGNSGAWVMTWTENNYNKWYDSDEDEVYYYGDSALNGRGKDYGYIAIV